MYSVVLLLVNMYTRQEGGGGGGGGAKDSLRQLVHAIAVLQGLTDHPWWSISPCSALISPAVLNWMDKPTQCRVYGI